MSIKIRQIFSWFCRHIACSENNWNNWIIPQWLR